MERKDLAHIYSIKCLAMEGAGAAEIDVDKECAGALKYTWHIGSVKKVGDLNCS